MILTEKKMRKLVEMIARVVVDKHLFVLEGAIADMERTVLRSTMKIQPVVGQVTITSSEAFYASSLAFLVPGESREVVLQPYSDIPPGSTVRLNDIRFVIEGCMVANVQQSMTDAVAAGEVILKNGARVGQNIRVVLHYPLPVTLPSE